jgi:hypothetical protein
MYCLGSELWGNVEVAEFVCKSLAKYLELYGKIHHSQVKDPLWRVVLMPRLAQKLTLVAEYCERIVCWVYQQYGRPDLGEKTVVWNQEYQKYLKGVDL